MLSDPGGVAVIVHAGRDNYANVPTRYTSAEGSGPDSATRGAGDAGGRFGCGVIGSSMPSPAGGYWMAAADGGVFSHGDASFHGSQGSRSLTKPVVGMGRHAERRRLSPSGLRRRCLHPRRRDVRRQRRQALNLNAPVVAIASPSADARAILRDRMGRSAGHVTFRQSAAGTKVHASISGLDPGSEFHGFHIHANGDCSGDFTAAGGHWNPGGAVHGDHSGDMPVLYADSTGVASTTFTTDAFTVAQLLGDEGGVAVMVHAGRDNYANIPSRYSTAEGPGPDAATKAAGDAGARGVRRARPDRWLLAQRLLARPRATEVCSPTAMLRLPAARAGRS